MSSIIKRFLILVFVTLSACAESDSGNVADSDKTASETLKLEVFKTPTCGCCGEWVSHLTDNGFSTLVQDRETLESIKADLHIPAEFQSCHTAVSEYGYFFEGHIPAKFIKQFLASPPENAAGLAVPGMPIGSPGMEMGGRFDPYKIFLVKKDGTTEIFAEVNSADE